MRVALFTLGCRLNCADSSLMESRFSSNGDVVVSQDADFDVAIVNTCAVTAEAVNKSKRLVKKIRREHPNAKIVVCGCAIEADHDVFRGGGADILLGNPGKKNIISVLRNCESSATLQLSKHEPSDIFYEKANGSFNFRTRAFIKIQEGCNNYCTYCIIPRVRGPERSRDVDEVLSDCRNAIEQGYHELVLTGVNTCKYCANDVTLIELLKKISALPGDFRIRLSSTEPNIKDYSLIDYMASDKKICRFLHLSLQNGCDEILRRMNRHYSSYDFALFAEYAKRKVPNLHLGTDIIVGFPGETNENFIENMNFVESMEFANIHIFPYSRRPDTIAATMPNQMSPSVIKERMTSLKNVAMKSSKKFTDSQKGKILPVIFERINNNIAQGWSDNYVEVKADITQNPIEIGKIVDIKFE